MKRRTMILGATSAAALPLVGAGTSAQATPKHGPPGRGGGRTPAGPLVIAEQGGFAVGGTVTSTPGTFDPTNPTDPAGQTCTATTPGRSTSCRSGRAGTRWCCGTASGRPAPAGERPPTGAKGSRPVPASPLRRLHAGPAPPRHGQPHHRRRPGQHGHRRAVVLHQFRLGLWPDLYPGVQFSDDPEALNQFFRRAGSG